MGTTNYAQAVAAGGVVLAEYVMAVFPETLWQTFVAIADAESAFDYRLINPSGATGYFQIEPLAGRPSQAALLDPLTNTQEAWTLYQRHGLEPWAGDGYLLYMPVAALLLNDARAARFPTGLQTVVSQIGQASGSVQIAAGGLVVARINLEAGNGIGLDYSVATVLTSGGVTVETFSPNPATGSLSPGRGTTVTQQAVVGVPQLRGPGGTQVTAHYGVQWTVTNLNTGAHALVKTAPGAISVVV